MICKEKGNIQECNNLCGIKLILHTMKLYKRIVDKINDSTMEMQISNWQFGFMPRRRTVDAFFAIRQPIEKYLEKEKSLYLVLLPLKRPTITYLGMRFGMDLRHLCPFT
uniref:Reverse transcriptase domain-containing protein n=1 Tax=Cacopsylla melanoneura TaxID=428564 RepID=A0A8D8PXZ7_9HEMI